MGTPKLRLTPLSRIMREPVTIGAEEQATKARKLMRDTMARVIVVVDDRGKLLGWLKRTSILSISSTKSEALVKDIMEDPPFSLSDNSTVGDAFKLMRKYDEWYGVVVGPTREVLGIVGMEDIVRLGLEEAREKLENVKVSDYMTRSVVYVKPDDFISSIWRLMQSLGYAGLPVVNERGRLVGIITQYDLIKKGYTRIELESESGPRPGARVRDAMTHSVVHVYPWTPLSEVAELIVERGFGRIPVVDGPRTRALIGVIDREDVARAVLELA